MHIHLGFVDSKWRVTLYNFFAATTFIIIYNTTNTCIKAIHQLTYIYINNVHNLASLNIFERKLTCSCSETQYFKILTQLFKYPMKEWTNITINARIQKPCKQTYTIPFKHTHTIPFKHTHTVLAKRCIYFLLRFSHPKINFIFSI